MPDTCPVCQSKDEIVGRASAGKDTYIVQCKYCGNYQISGTAAAVDLTKHGTRWKISAAIRNKYENGKIVELNTGNISNIIDSIVFPEDPFEYIDKLIEYIFKKTGEIGNTVNLNSYDFPIICAENIDNLII